LALVDFLVSGGKSPVRDSASDLCLRYLNVQMVEGEIRRLLKDEFSGTKEITRENCVFRNDSEAIFMISGNSPLFDEDTKTEADCATKLLEMENDFLKYIKDADEPK
jgi:hypothetical protein